MCIVCRHPDRIAIEAVLEAGRSLRAVAADYPDLNRNSLHRHRRDHMTRPPAVAPTATGTADAPQDTPASPIVRRRTRPQTDEAERLGIVLRMTARGCTKNEIARALRVHPSTIRDLVRSAKENAVEQVRSETVHELVAQHRAERNARVAALHAILDAATLSGDVRTGIDVLRELRHEAKEDREWMRELGAFDQFRDHAARQRDRYSEDERVDELQDALRELTNLLGRPDPDEALSTDGAGTVQ